MIFGIAGPNGAGKGEVVRYLSERSFASLSLSDVIREELARKGEAESRERMIALGTELREVGGVAVLAERAIAMLKPGMNYAIDSIRHPAEVAALRASGQSFQLLWVDASIETRLARILERGRPGDPRTASDLERLEAKELGSDDPSSQQLLAVRDLADFRLDNGGALELLYAQIHTVFEQNLFFERPSWDDYFMSIAETVASRSNCVKRKVAAVVTRDRRIISTGYNGTPRGTRNCNEGGCPRCNGLSPGGTQLDECRCSHGEENAISQAAYHGVSLKGGSIYTTFSPCLQCTKLIINSGLVEVIYNTAYPLGGSSLDLLREGGVSVRQASSSAEPDAQ
jgi:dCMP deaminase